MWVRGLKHGIVEAFIKDLSVAPYVGAWIETIIITYLYPANFVAPYVGAWIET